MSAQLLSFDSTVERPLIVKVASPGPDRLRVSWRPGGVTGNVHVATAWLGTSNVSTCSMKVHGIEGMCELNHLQRFTYYSVSVKACNASTDGFIGACGRSSELVSQRTSIESELHLLWC